MAIVPVPGLHQTTGWSRLSEFARDPFQISVLGRKPYPRLEPHPDDPVARRYDVIQFQFAPTDLMIDGGVSWGEATMPGGEYPVVQFAGVVGQRIRFHTLFWAETGVESIDGNVKALEAAVGPDREYGRPPIWLFVWDSVMDPVSVVIESIGGQRVENVRGGLPIIGGAGLRGMSFDITLRKYAPFDIVKTDPAARTTDTYRHHVRTGDTWELIARTRYNDPMKGVLLRRRNPDKPLLEIGQIVSVLKPARLRGVSIAPDSIPLRRTAAGIAARDEMFRLRGASKRSTILSA